MTPEDIDRIVARVVLSTWRKRFAERMLPYEFTEELHDLRNDVIRNVTWTLKSEIGAVPTSPPEPQDQSDPPLADQPPEQEAFQPDVAPS